MYLNYALTTKIKIPTFIKTFKSLIAKSK